MTHEPSIQLDSVSSPSDGISDSGLKRKALFLARCVLSPKAERGYQTSATGGNRGIFSAQRISTRAGESGIVPDGVQANHGV
ncbi:hypothetical protein AYL99_11012 [Fonsecaea erecta]|uniref:Uncharacterized protein n=1 Tax=Fonsecaea erecta TaxID=1367422 RepID=A0A178Z497_9EURO|nr:hypothetical protein AYL99_11012 [Fonsecaea erecta]OAP54564.1 hypothetical protein AYL99_11012 [Fonsecaea erecta]